jgi:hypothetical protein
MLEEIRRKNEERRQEREEHLRRAGRARKEPGSGRGGKPKRRDDEHGK